jgi:beta-glucosidase
VLVATVALDDADMAFFNAKGGQIGIWTNAASKAVLDDFCGGTIG